MGSRTGAAAIQNTTILWPNNMAGAVQSASPRNACVVPALGGRPKVRGPLFKLGQLLPAGAGLDDSQGSPKVPELHWPHLEQGEYNTVKQGQQTIFLREIFLCMSGCTWDREERGLGHFRPPLELMGNVWPVPCRYYSMPATPPHPGCNVCASPPPPPHLIT